MLSNIQPGLEDLVAKQHPKPFVSELEDLVAKQHHQLTTIGLKIQLYVRYLVINPHEELRLYFNVAS